MFLKEPAITLAQECLIRRVVLPMFQSISVGIAGSYILFVLLILSKELHAAAMVDEHLPGFEASSSVYSVL